jgi:hypothetical protein
MGWQVRHHWTSKPHVSTRLTWGGVLHTWVMSDRVNEHHPSRTRDGPWRASAIHLLRSIRPQWFGPTRAADFGLCAQVDVIDERRLIALAVGATWAERGWLFTRN